MHRYEELEKLYYKKLYIRYFIYFLVLVFSIFLVSFIYFSTKTTPKSKHNIKKNIKEANISIQKKTKPKNKPKPQKYIKKLTLYPIYPEIELLNQKSSKEINKTKNMEKIIPKSKPHIQPIKNEKKEVKKTPEIKIIIKTETIQDLINFYKTNPDFNNGMKIAKYYFEHKKYEDSIKWCKKVNKIEPEKYESWYLFAKNLIQLNKNKEAKKVLIYYLSSYGPNDKIEKLLRSIK